jgi:hypothetical protein
VAAYVEQALGSVGLPSYVLAYANLKDEVARRDPSRAHVYSRVWSVLGELQPGGPYGA